VHLYLVGNAAELQYGGSIRGNLGCSELSNVGFRNTVREDDRFWYILAGHEYLSHIQWNLWYDSRTDSNCGHGQHDHKQQGIVRDWRGNYNGSNDNHAE
jgi:hypothetical protein